MSHKLACLCNEKWKVSSHTISYQPCSSPDSGIGGRLPRYRPINSNRNIERVRLPATSMMSIESACTHGASPSCRRGSCGPGSGGFLPGPASEPRAARLWQNQYGSIRSPTVSGHTTLLWVLPTAHRMDPLITVHGSYFHFTTSRKVQKFVIKSDGVYKGTGNGPQLAPVLFWMKLKGDWKKPFILTFSCLIS